MTKPKLSVWTLLFLISTPCNVRAFDFANLLYSLNFCRGPGRFCPEPNCITDRNHHLCKWYDCSSSSYSGRYLEDTSNGTCTFFGSEASCAGDRMCIKACKELNGGTCPQCISFYQAGSCQDSASFSSASVSSSSSSYSANSNGGGGSSRGSGMYKVNLTFYYVLAGILLVGAAVAVMMKRKNPPAPLAEQLHPVGDGLVQSRIEAVEAGNAKPISTIEDRTNFRRSRPDSMIS